MIPLKVPNVQHSIEGKVPAFDPGKRLSSKMANSMNAQEKLVLIKENLQEVLEAENLKAPIELVKFRAAYCKFVITSLLKSVNVPVERLEFVLGGSYQLSEKHTMDLQEAYL